MWDGGRQDHSAVSRGQHRRLGAQAIGTAGTAGTAGAAIIRRFMAVWRGAGVRAIGHRHGQTTVQHQPATQQQTQDHAPHADSVDGDCPGVIMPRTGQLSPLKKLRYTCRHLITLRHSISARASP